ncbi:MAG: MFS transporter [Chloroflexi bacterium]|nr:MFS transporter [Chloroflexota bacterium]
MSAPARSGGAGGGRLQPFVALENPAFRNLWVASLAVMISMWMEATVLGWLMLELTNSPLQVALVGFYRSVSLPLLGAFSGLLADRANRKHLLIGARFGAVVTSSVLLVLIATGLIRPWSMALLLLLSGVSFTIDFPARPAYVYDLLGPRGVANGMSLDTVGFTISRIVGPVLAGTLISLAGNTAGLAYAVVVALYVLALILVLTLPALERRAAAQLTVWRSLWEGARYALSVPMVRAVLAGTVVMNLLAFPFQQLLPVFARDVLGGGPVQLGLLFAAGGIGSLAGALAFAVAPPGRRGGPFFGAGCLAILVCLFLFSFSPWFGLSFLLLVLSGLGQAAFSVLQSTLILVSTSDEMRGRAMGMLTLAIGAGPVGTMLVGYLASLLTAPPAVAIATGAGLGLMGVSLVMFPALRKSR